MLKSVRWNYWKELEVGIFSVLVYFISLVTYKMFFQIVKSELFFSILVLIWLQHVMLIVWGSSTEAPGPEDDNDDNNEADENGIFVGNLSLCQNVSNRVFLPYVGDCRKYYLCWGT